MRNGNNAINRAAGFNLQRQLAVQRNPSRACVALAAGVQSCPRDRSDPTVVRTQQQFNERFARTPQGNPPSNLFRLPTQRRRSFKPGSRPLNLPSCGESCSRRRLR